MRRALYRLARLLGDVKAVSSGRPKPLIRRLVNKKIGRKIASKLWWK